MNEITCTSQYMSTAVSVHTFSFVTIIIIQIELNLLFSVVPGSFGIPIEGANTKFPLAPVVS